jgi:hypothetical protein
LKTTYAYNHSAHKKKRALIHDIIIVEKKLVEKQLDIPRTDSASAAGDLGSGFPAKDQLELGRLRKRKHRYIIYITALAFLLLHHQQLCSFTISSHRRIFN